MRAFTILANYEAPGKRFNHITGFSGRARRPLHSVDVCGLGLVDRWNAFEQRRFPEVAIEGGKREARPLREFQICSVVSSEAVLSGYIEHGLPSRGSVWWFNPDR